MPCPALGIRGMAAVACVYGAAGIGVYSVSRAAMLGRASGQSWRSSSPASAERHLAGLVEAKSALDTVIQCSGTPFTTYGHLEK